MTVPAEFVTENTGSGGSCAPVNPSSSGRVAVEGVEFGMVLVVGCVPRPAHRRPGRILPSMLLPESWSVHE